jgi:hypothetical protein
MWRQECVYIWFILSLIYLTFEGIKYSAIWSMLCSVESHLKTAFFRVYNIRNLYVSIKTVVLWEVTFCFIDRCQHVGGTCHLSFLGHNTFLWNDSVVTKLPGVTPEDHNLCTVCFKAHLNGSNPRHCIMLETDYMWSSGQYWSCLKIQGNAE